MMALFHETALLVTILISAHAGLLPHNSRQQIFFTYQPRALQQPPASFKVQETSEPADYHYDYSVADQITGDYHSQEENRHGDRVDGKYSLVEPNGQRRTVKYTADSISGFIAQVQREPTNIRIPAAPLPPLQIQSSLTVPVRPFADYGLPPNPAPLPPSHPSPPLQPPPLAPRPPAPRPPSHKPPGLYGPPSAPQTALGFGSSLTSFSSPHAQYSYSS